MPRPCIRKTRLLCHSPYFQHSLRESKLDYNSEFKGILLLDA